MKIKKRSVNFVISSTLSLSLSLSHSLFKIYINSERDFLILKLKNDYYAHYNY